MSASVAQCIDRRPHPDPVDSTLLKSAEVRRGDMASLSEIWLLVLPPLWHVDRLKRNSTRSAAGSDKAERTPGSPTSSTSASRTSRQFKREHALAADGGDATDWAPRRRRRDGPARRGRRARRGRPRGGGRPRPSDDEDEDDPTRTARTGTATAQAPPAGTPRGPRPPRAAGAGKRDLEGTFDHGDEGYGLWLDPAIQDDPVYAEHWAGHRPVVVTVEADRIVIKRSGGDAGDDDESDSDDE